ncbi:MAG: hypothetical protein KF856_11550 [Cyclobacteriaceae bacterium]|nr:hypothetical protein [Cyclobacteriaceae bacterium]
MRLVFLVLLIVNTIANAQSTNAPLNSDYYYGLDRYEIKSGKISPQLFTTVKPYKRDAIVRYIDTLKASGEIFTSSSDQFNLEFFRNDSWEWSRTESNTSKKPILKQLYKKKSDLTYVDIPEFDIHVNPVLYLGAGKDNNRDELITINTRGVEIRGMVDRKIGFYTYVGENQAILPQYVADEVTRNRVVPHEGFWKTFKDTGVDFFEARAYIDFNVSKHIYMQFGNDRTFIGNGYRSLIFSDYSPPNLFLRTNVKVWKINYLFQLNRMAANARTPGNKRYPEKFIAFHHASLNIGKKLNVGLFESVVFSPKDSVNNNTFDFSYLNPVIFYRAIEQQFGSSDNAILGADIKWNAFKKVSFYGQLVLDEFLLEEIMAGNGWWANKYAIQGGVKYIDAFGVSNLDIQAEINRVRPYTYSHYSQYGSYSNYRQALAHPLGANFNEVVGIIRYQPLPRINFTLKAFYAKIGRDNTDENWGGNILLGYQLREREYGNVVGQGISNTIATVDFNASYMLKHNLFIDARQIVRQSTSELATYNYNTTLTSLALRWNIPQRSYDF